MTVYDLTRDTAAATGSWAWLSDDRTHRYRLGRRWSEDGPLDVWIMLNPSTADATKDDPTIRRCRGFSQRWGAGGLVVVNLFSLRSTDPAALLRHPDPTGGEENDRTLIDVCQRADEDGGRVIAAWGAHPMAAERAREVRAMVPSTLLALGSTKAGAPRHPLYVKGDAKLTAWTPR